MRRDAPWLAEEALVALPPGLGPWGSVSFPAAKDRDAELQLQPARDAGELGEHIADEADNPVYFVWSPGDRHVRTIYELDAIAEQVAVRGRREARQALRKAMPKALGAIGLLLAGILFWPTEPQLQMFALLAAILLMLPMWQKGVEVVWDAWRDGHRIDRDPAGWRARETTRMRFSIWAQGVRSLAATGLVAAFGVLFLVTFRDQGAVAFERFALVKDRVGEEPWRLVTCAFLHANFMHIFFNGAAGLSLAGIARCLVRESDILLVFLVSAVAGSIASVLLTPASSIGASGGILGWGGMLLGIALCRRELRGTALVKQMTRWVILIGAIGFAGAGFIDNAAHAGGFLAGLAMGVMIARGTAYEVPTRATGLGRVFWIQAIAVIAVVLWMVAAILQA